MPDSYEALKAQRDRIESEQRRALATRIARDLFTNGLGERASRLLLTTDSPLRLDLGGWSESAMVDRIEQILAERGEVKD